MAAPDVLRMRVRRPAGDVFGIALVLHGGKVRSRRRPQLWNLAVARMTPFARDLHRSGSPRGLAVASVLYRYRGWNGAGASPVADAREALATLRAKFGDVPVALVGHSMGGRVALRCADEPNVVGVVALAPWIERGEPLAQLTGKQLLVLHGNRDRTTDPRASVSYVEAAAEIAAGATRIEIRGDGHGMLGRAKLWKALTTGFVLDTLDLPSPSEAASINQSEGASETNAARAVLQRVQAGEVLLSI